MNSHSHDPGNGSQDPHATRGSAVFQSAPQIFGVAQRSYARCVADGVRLPIEDMDAALTTVLFAALSTEVFINELADMADSFARAGIDGSPQLAAFAAAALETEESRKSTRSKYRIAGEMLAKRPFEKDRATYRDFDFLISLRDFVVHLKPDRLEWIDSAVSRDAARIDNGLTERRLLHKREGVATSLLSDISTAPVAEWALAVASAIIREVVLDLPPGILSEIYRRYVSQGYFGAPLAAEKEGQR